MSSLTFPEAVWTASENYSFTRFLKSTIACALHFANTSFSYHNLMKACSGFTKIVFEIPSSQCA